MAHKIYNWYWNVSNPVNVLRAINNTKRNKGSRCDVKYMMEVLGYANTALTIHELLKNETFEPSRYEEKTINDGKERHLKIAPLIPDRIIHHCIVDPLEAELKKLYINNTYACIKGRGIHKCLEDVNKALQSDKRGTKYCLKIDLRHYYDSVKHDILKKIVASDVGDKKLLRLLYKIIDSTDGDGIPIGFLTSQHFANWYLTPFDHWMKEQVHAKHYFRYMDDIVILAESKEWLHEVLNKMQVYLQNELGLEVKQNWQIFPVDARSIDFVGYKSNHYNVLARKSILQTYWAKLRKIQKKYKCIEWEKALQLMASNYGWLQHCTEEHYIELMSRTYKQLITSNIMNTEILKTGLTSKEVQPTFDVIDRIKGTTLYNFNQHWIEVEEEGEVVRLNQYDSLRVLYPITENNIFATLITAKYENNEEQKLQNDYNAAVLGIEDEEAKQPYLDFLEDRKALRAMVHTDCERGGIQ